MKATIYNFNNEPTRIDNEKEVRKICVQVLSGDEVVKFFYKDGSREIYDSGSGTRLEDFDDGLYVVSDPSQIQTWLDFIPRADSNIREAYSYQRQTMFDVDGDFADDKNILEEADFISGKYIMLDDLPDPKPVEEGNFNNEDFSKVYNRGFADGWNSLLRELKGEEDSVDG